MESALTEQEHIRGIRKKRQEGVMASSIRVAADKLLIAEDSPAQAEKITRLVKEHGYRVTFAENGQEALHHAQKERPDLVISDIVMPLLDGYELCAAIKSDPILQRVPVILLSTLSSSADIIRGLEVGLPPLGRS